MNKTVYVGFKFLHMGPHAGYDLIKNHANYDIFLDCQADYVWVQSLLRKQNLVSKIYRLLFGNRLWWVELRCLLLALFNRNLIFHFIYAENIYMYLGWFKWLGFKIVCTYHQPVSFFHKHQEHIQSLRRADKVIVLSEEVVQAFKGFKGDEGVYFIPHGVDIDFFSADISIPRKREVLMVGNWLRNFGFADQVFANLLQVDTEVHVHVVASRENLDTFGKNPRLHLHFGISDEELKLLYRSAAVLFLPLHCFVANNAVLESSAVGCPVLIASDQGENSMPKYIVENILLSKDVVLLKILDRLDHTDHQGSLRRNWIVQNVSWNVIGKETQRIFSECFARD